MEMLNKRDICLNTTIDSTITYMLYVKGKVKMVKLGVFGTTTGETLHVRDLQANEEIDIIKIAPLNELKEKLADYAYNIAKGKRLCFFCKKWVAEKETKPCGFISRVCEKCYSQAQEIVEKEKQEE